MIQPRCPFIVAVRHGLARIGIADGLQNGGMGAGDVVGEEVVHDSVAGSGSATRRSAVSVAMMRHGSMPLAASHCCAEDLRSWCSRSMTWPRLVKPCGRRSASHRLIPEQIFAHHFQVDGIGVRIRSREYVLFDDGGRTWRLGGRAMRQGGRRWVAGPGCMPFARPDKSFVARSRDLWAIREVDSVHGFPTVHAVRVPSVARA